MADAQIAAAGTPRPLRFAAAAPRPARVAPHARATLVSGETGTGTSAVARALHRLGPQRGGAFHTLTSTDAWVPEGASGTVFVPDVGELGRDVQVALARGLAGAAVAPVGEGLLQTLRWPGSLRELRNVVERASVLWDGDVLAESAVRAALARGGAPSAASAAPAPSARLDDAQHQHISAVLAAAGGNKTTAAAHLGVSRRALYRLIDRLERTASGRA